MWYHTYFLSVVINPLPDGSKSILDEIATAFFTGNNNRGVGRLNYPRITFSGRSTSLSLLSANEKVGKLLLVYLLCQTKRGLDVMAERCDPQFDDKKADRRNMFDGHRQAADDEEVPLQEAPLVEEDPDDDEQHEDQQNMTMTTRTSFSKQTYNNTADRFFVNGEMGKVGLQFLCDWCDSMNKDDALTVRRIAWECR